MKDKVLDNQAEELAKALLNVPANDQQKNETPPQNNNETLSTAPINETVTNIPVDSNSTNNNVNKAIKKVKKPKVKNTQILAQSFLIHIFKGWRDKIIYIDNCGNYRLKEKGKEKGKIAQWNKEIKKMFPNNTDFVVRYKKASKAGLLANKKTIKLPPTAKESQTKSLLLRRTVKKLQTISETELLKPKLNRRETPRTLAEAQHVNLGTKKPIVVGKSINGQTIKNLYDSGLKAIQNLILNECPKIFIIDILQPKHRVPMARFLVEANSPEAALTKIRDENEKRNKKNALFGEDDILKLVVPVFKNSLMEV